MLLISATELIARVDLPDDYESSIGYLLSAYPLVQEWRFVSSGHIVRSVVQTIFPISIKEG